MYLKESGTFSDTLECLGVAVILKKVFKKIDLISNPEIIIEDKGGYFKITSNKELTEESIQKCEYFDFIRYIKNKNDKKKEFEFDFIDYEHEKEIRDIAYKNRNDENAQSVRPDYDIIRMFANMDGYKNSFNNCRACKHHFPSLLSFILKMYSSFEKGHGESIKEISSFTKQNQIKIIKINSLQDINPAKGKGVNQLKANGINPKGQSAFWLNQLIRFTGAWECFISRYFNKDVKTYALVPKRISTQYLRTVFEKLKPFVRGTDSIKMDILLLHLTLIELIRYDEKFKLEWSFMSPSDKISGFQFAYYKNLGQRPAVTNIGFLGLPNFVKFNSEEEGLDWIEVWKEHKTIINNIDEGNSSNISMLQNYRQFLSASDFNSFFEFQYDYASFLISAYNENKFYIKAFNLNNMEVSMASIENYSEIIQNTGFISIAKAIRNSTINPIIHKEKKDVMFGLNQKIKIASRTKDSLLTEISEFIQKYNETMMLKDYHSKKHKKYVTTEEFEKFCKLFDANYSPKLIAGLLVAYGYAKEPSSEKSVNETNNNQFTTE